MVATMNNFVLLDTTPFSLVESDHYFEDRVPPTLW